VPAARVLHRVDASHLTLRYLYRYGEQKGIASRKMHSGGGAPGRFAEAAYLAKGLWQLLKGRGDRFRQCLINMGIVRGLRGRA
jgi:hypothetical protein